MTKMTEEQVERRVERMTDHLDRLLMTGAMAQRDYDEAMDDLNRWAAAHAPDPDDRREERAERRAMNRLEDDHRD